jgi:hypothetical protein
MCGESRWDKFANSSISIDSTRRCIDNSASGSASVMKPAAAGRVDRRPASFAGFHDSSPVGSEPVPAGEELAACRDDVGAAFEQRDHVVDVEKARHVQHAVGRELGDRGPVGGRGNSGRRFAAQDARVEAVLLGVVDQHADQLEGWGGG